MVDLWRSQSELVLAGVLGSADRMPTIGNSMQLSFCRAHHDTDADDTLVFHRWRIYQFVTSFSHPTNIGRLIFSVLH